MIDYKLGNIDLSTIKGSEVLFWIRIRGKNSYFKNEYTPALINTFKNISSFKTVSEYPRLGTYYINVDRNVSSQLCDEKQKVFNKLLDLNDCILRCRGLRQIKFDEAHSLIIRAFNSSYDIIKKQKEIGLKLFVTNAVDNYIMDIFSKLCIYFNVKILPITNSFLSPQYKLCSLYGERNAIRSPSSDEINTVVAEIKNRYSNKSQLTYVSKLQRIPLDFVKNAYKLIFRYYLGYKLLGKLSYEHRFAKSWCNFGYLENISPERYFTNIEKLTKFKNEKLVYIPLHLTPEATTDYWLPRPNYLTSLLKCLRNLRQNGFIPILKEHPAFAFRRKTKFYKGLIKLGYHIISFDVPTNTILKIIDKVVIWNGSTGIEAMVNGNRILFLDCPYYLGNREAFQLSKPISNSDFLKYDLKQSLYLTLSSSIKT
jgi:hypothetical protein